MGIPADREAELLAQVPTGLLIDGQWRDASGGRTFDVEDPATGKVLLSIADASTEDGALAMDAAAAAQDAWARTAPRERGEILRRAFEIVTERTAGRSARRRCLRRGVPALVLGGSRAGIRPLQHLAGWKVTAAGQ